MKKLRNTLALLLALLMVLSVFALPASAATIKNVKQYGAQGGYVAFGDSIGRGCGSEGFYLDGKATVVAGTHTHVMTADDKILRYGTGYITDCGMTGAYESVLGMDKDVSIKRLALKIPMRYEPADGPAFMCGIVFETDESGRCLSLRRFCEYE